MISRITFGWMPLIYVYWISDSHIGQQAFTSSGHRAGMYDEGHNFANVEIEAVIG